MNKIKFIILHRSLFGTESISAAVLIFFFTKYMGLSLSEYIQASSLIFLIAAAAQVPAGVISDWLGRKRVLLISEFAYGLMQLALILFPTKATFYASIVVFPIASSLASGTFDSLLFEIQQGENDFRKWMKWSAKVSIISGSILAILGGYLAKIHLALPLAIDASLILIGACATWWIIPPLESAKKRNLIDMKMVISSAVDFSTQEQPFFLKKSLFAALIFAAVRCLFSIYAPFLEFYAFEISEIGWIVGGLGLISALLIQFFARLNRESDIFDNLEFKMIVLISASGVLAYWGTAAAFLALLGQQVLRTLSIYYSRYQLHALIPANHPSRVTLVSFGFFLNMALCALVNAIQGFLISKLPINSVFSSICILTSLVGAIFYTSSMKGKSHVAAIGK